MPVFAEEPTLNENTVEKIEAAVVSKAQIEEASEKYAPAGSASKVLSVLKNLATIDTGLILTRVVFTGGAVAFGFSHYFSIPPSAALTVGATDGIMSGFFQAIQKRGFVTWITKKGFLKPNPGIEASLLESLMKEFIANVAYLSIHNVVSGWQGVLPTYFSLGNILISAAAGTATQGIWEINVNSLTNRMLGKFPQKQKLIWMSNTSAVLVLSAVGTALSVSNMAEGSSAKTLMMMMGGLGFVALFTHVKPKELVRSFFKSKSCPQALAELKPTGS